MTDESQLKIIDFWQKVAEEKGLYDRQIINKINLRTKEVIDIIGPRRSGKSSVMKIMAQKLKNKGNYLYINFEDPYFINHNSPYILEELIETYKEYFQKNLIYVFFDEVQNIISWEKTVRKLRDSGQYKIFVSGSSSKLMNAELSSLLSGRHISYRLMPLSYKEYLDFQGIKIESKKDIILKEKMLLRHFNDYLKWGGFPAVVLSKNQELLKQYYLDIIQKDIVKRYDVREKEILEKMGIYLLTNSAKIISVSATKNLYNISHELSSTYLEYFKESFLIFDVPQFSYSIKTQQKALKKIYAVDTGLVNTVSFHFSEDKGRMLETSVYLALKQLDKEIFYYKTSSGREVDFFIKENIVNKQFIQVAWNIEDELTKKRETESLLEAMEEEKINNGIILTHNTREKILVKGKHIYMKPVYQWLLELQS